MADASVIVGRNPVREALERRPDEIEKVLVQRGASGGAIGQIRKAAAEAGIPMQYVPAGRLSNMARGANHQGVAAVAAAVSYQEVELMLSDIAPTPDVVRARKPLLLALDRIQDPYNYGALLRSAVAAQVAGVIVPTTHMAPLSPTVMKASAGMAARVPIARVEHLAHTLYSLKERGYWVLGSSGGGGQSVWDTDWDRPIALVMGSEGEGMREDVAEQCDEFVSIPMPGSAESLNVSVAGGILLFSAVRARLRSDAS